MIDLFLLCSVLVTPLFALPAEPLNPRDDFLRTRSPSFEWTAWGDSYASGVGAGEYIDGRRCLRYADAYPEVIDSDPEGLLKGSGGKFNNVVCSGAKAEEVEEYQFYDTQPYLGQPTWQYYPRPATGKPTMGTLTVGGDDIDFPGILNNCILEGFPFPLSTGFTKRSCDDQRTLSWSLITSDSAHTVPHPELVGKIDSLIKKIVTYGKKNENLFKLYVTGYGQFFNDKDTYCDKVTFARTANPKDDGEPHVMMTAELRKDFNNMSKMLNAAIKKAVEQNTGTSTVRYIDIDAELEGKRFCESGVKEPDQNNAKAAFFHYPYGIKEQDPPIVYLNQVAARSASTLSWDPKKTLWVDYMNEFWSKVDEEGWNAATGGDVNTQANPWPDTIGHRARIFHPTQLLHNIIYEKIVKQYLKDEEDEGPDDNGGGTGGQQLAIASYTNPGEEAAWLRYTSVDSSKLSVLVANVLNGPDYVVDQAWQKVINQAAGSGKTVIGYVRTGYLGVSKQQFKTRLGSGDLADWASQIMGDVDKWFELYPTLGGIFFDEGWPECGTSGDKNIYSNLYASINAYTKRKHPGVYTVLNPGSSIEQCYEDTMDTLLTFESNYGNYTAAYTPNNWTAKDDRKIWHIVYDVPQEKIAEVAALSRERHVGYLEVTDDNNGYDNNPYDKVPDTAYLAAAAAAVSGGKVLKGSAPTLGGSYAAGVPSDARVTASDYTSVTITWSSVSGALGYAVYQNGALVAELPASLTRATIGMLKPGTSGISFEVKTLLSSGGGGGSRSISASTKSLPSDGSISNVKYTKNGGTVVYTADVLVPYAFVRLFIGGPHKAVGSSKGWPINASINNETGGADPIQQYKLVNYMVEGNDFASPLRHYTGAYMEGQAANADWTWSYAGEAPQHQSGYTYTWNVPLGGTDALPEDYVVQGQGYAPIQNVFGGSLRSYKCEGQPCDDNPDYDCKGSTLCTTPDLLKWCDIAVNNLTRTDSLTYGTSGGAPTGNCWGDGSRGCGVFIQGSNCAISGNDMWNKYQDLRKLGGCSKCGSFHREDGCLLTVNYVSNCDIGLPTPEIPPGN